MVTAGDGKQRDSRPICVNVKLQFVFNNEGINICIIFLYFMHINFSELQPKHWLTTKIATISDVLVNFFILIW